MKAKCFLRQIEKLDSMIKNKVVEQDQWRSIAMGTTAPMGGERVQSSGNKQKMADAVERFVEIERDINRSIDILVDTKNDVISVIEQLKTIEYDILHKLYVQYMSLYDVADIYDKSYSWVTTIHGRALKNVQTILDQREKEEVKEVEIAN